VEELNALYCRLLQLGFIVLRQAIHSRNDDWIQAEIELLHNVPSLIGEANLERHRYFWFTERTHHIEWASAPGRDEAKSRMLTYYEPTWREMEPVLLGMLERT
jgi:hypothetical protein